MDNNTSVKKWEKEYKECYEFWNNLSFDEKKDFLFLFSSTGGKLELDNAMTLNDTLPNQLLNFIRIVK